MDYYIELESLPGFGGADQNPFLQQGADRVIRKVKESRGRQVLYMGYPVRLRQHRARSGWEGFFMEPVLLWPIDLESDGPTLSADQPFFNFKALRQLSVAGESNVLEESAALLDELGLDSAPGDGPELDELAHRLRRIRAEWDWKENLDVDQLTGGDSLAELNEAGIYNRAVLVPAERSPFTRGLELELKDLMKLDESDYQNTALGYWLSHYDESDNWTGKMPQSLIEVVPLNTEQREAILSGLSEPITVITGPPGTGKSQVVAGLLTNAAWNGTKVLLASKNNKAVDVVHDRVNGLAKSPSLLRLGSNDKQFALAEHLLSLLSTRNSEHDVSEYEHFLKIHERLNEKVEAIDKQVEEVRLARNMVDELEQLVVQFRDDWGSSVFETAAHTDLEVCKSALTKLV